MGIFEKKEIRFENAHCCRCGKKIRDRKDFNYMDGKVYCRKCAQAEKDWNALTFLSIFDDD